MGSNSLSRVGATSFDKKEGVVEGIPRGILTTTKNGLKGLSSDSVRKNEHGTLEFETTYLSDSKDKLIKNNGKKRFVKRGKASRRKRAKRKGKPVTVTGISEPQLPLRYASSHDSFYDECRVEHKDLAEKVPLLSNT